MRAAIYCRVSTDEQAERGHSIEAQQRLLREFCQRKGWEVATEYVDAGESGKTMARPEMARMLEQARATPPPFEVIAVHKLDRFSRSMLDTVRTLAELREHGIGFVSATEDFDFTTPVGKVLLALLSAFAEVYIDNLSKETSKGKEQRARKGLYNGSLPFGYQSAPRVEGQPGQPPVLHAGNIHAYLFAVQAIAAGQMPALVAEWLNSNGYRTTGNWGARPFGPDAVVDMIHSRFYLGEVSYKGQWMPGKHPAAIDADTWQRAQNAIARRRAVRSTANTRARAYPLRQLLYCETCRQSFRGWGSHTGKRYYRDTARLKGLDCPHQAAWQADVLEGEVAHIMASVVLADDWQQQALALLEDDTNHGDVERQRTALEGQLSRAKTLFLYGDIDKAEYYAQKTKLQRQIDGLPSAANKVDLEGAAKALQKFSGLWEGATLEEREELLHAMLNRVYVRAGAVVALEPDKNFWALLAGAQIDMCHLRERRDSGTDEAHITILPPGHRLRP